MRSIAIGLDLGEHFFDEKINEKCHTLRLLSYPPIKTTLLNDGQTRAGAHSGSSCLLFICRTHFERPNFRLWHINTPVPGLCWWFRSSKPPYRRVCAGPSHRELWMGFNANTDLSGYFPYIARHYRCQRWRPPSSMEQ